MKLFKILPRYSGYAEVITEVEWEMLPRKMQAYYEELANGRFDDDAMDEAASKLALRGKEPDDFSLNNKGDQL